MNQSPGFYYRESPDHLRAGWYNYNYNDNPAIEEGAIIVSLKRSGDLFRRRYAVKNMMETAPIIDAWVEDGTLPQHLEVLPGGLTVEGWKRWQRSVIRRSEHSTMPEHEQ